MSPITGAQYLLQTLHHMGVRHIFTIPGASIDPLLLALSEFDGIQEIVCSHELGAGFMADGYRRVQEDVPSVIAIIGGPGLTNILTAIATAYQEFQSVLLITGDVPRPHQNKRAFQSTPDDQRLKSQLSSLLVKSTDMVQQVHELPQMIADAIALSQTAPDGPVHISIPYDIFLESFIPDQHVVVRKRAEIDPGCIAHVKALLNNHSKVLLGIGEEIPLSQASVHAIKKVFTQFSLPVVTTLGAKGLIPDKEPWTLGNFGYGGQPLANRLLCSKELEALVLIGVPLGERNTLNWNPAFFEGRQVIVISHQEKEDIGLPNGSTVHWIQTDLEAFLTTLALTEEDPTQPFKQQRETWYQSWLERNMPKPLPENTLLEQAISMSTMIPILNQYLPVDTRLFVDAGYHKLMAARYWEVKQPRSFFASAIYSATGWAIGAGIGAQLASPHHPVVIVTGDGCMQMHGIEIYTAVRYSIPVLIIICHNQTLGNIFQRYLKYSEDIAHQIADVHIDWLKLGEALGIESQKVSSMADFAQVLSSIYPLSRPFLLVVDTYFDISYSPDTLAISAYA